VLGRAGRRAEGHELTAAYRARVALAVGTARWDDDEDEQ
jgi:hypothetical protein